MGAGERHTSLAGALPGRPGKALNSPEMGVAVEDSKSFLDMDQTPDPFTRLIVCKDSSARPESVSVRL